MEHYSDTMLVKKIQKILEVLNEKQIVSTGMMENISVLEADFGSDTIPADDAGWKPFENGDILPGDDRHFWFRYQFSSPKVKDDEAVYLSYKTGREMEWNSINPQILLFLNGEPVQGLDTYHSEVLVDSDTEYTVHGNLFTGLKKDSFLFEASYYITNTTLAKLYYDILVPYETANLFDVDDYNHTIIMRALENAVRLIDMRDLNAPAFIETAKDAVDYLDKEFYHGICENNKEILVTCIGHTHIDVAWQWRLRDTEEKAQRSFATVLKLMEEYPEYQFMSSQPQLYKFVKQHSPVLYERIKERIKEGRWEAEGGMWVEADCNLSGGESLVRQFLLGKRFMKEEFGVDNKILWLPDVFGYSAALPQILKKSGIDTFVTSKISWNDCNRMPYDTFLWEGIDGTDMFTYFITAQRLENVNDEPRRYCTYVCEITPAMTYGTWKRYEPKGFNTDTCVTFGHGDGGGGPTRKMLEYQKRLCHGLPGIPRTKTGNPTEFISKVKNNFYKNMQETGRAPRWCGELYLENHRGTYTTIAANKNYNRRSEFAYREAELLSGTAMSLLGSAYPQKELYDGWEIICLNQFHDIIPGSSIREVYEDSKAQYEEILAKAEEISSAAASALVKNIASDKDGYVVINPHSFAYSGTIEIDGALQRVEDIPAFGWKVVTPVKDECRVTVTENTISNQYYDITIENGDIVSLYDKRANRELVKAGCKMNRFVFFEDYPYAHDAWDVNKYGMEKEFDCDEVLPTEIVTEGARAGLKITKKFGKSTFTQVIYLYNEDERIDFVTEADWHEDHILCKADFPFDIHTNEASFEIQYGSVKRPTHTNTSWDEARFEVCAQKWVDVSESDYGVSILNDCKYGYGASGSDINISLLRSPTFPHPEADRGHHKFTYSLLPHNCALADSKTIQEAYKLNQAPRVCEISAQEGKLPQEYSLISVNSDSVIIEAVKKAEDDDALIVRLFEHGNVRENITLSFGFDASEVKLCSMMEEEEGEIAVENNTVSFEIKPFEIVTLKVK
ncbi:MAG: alpha-mannosidase [Clostridia bacterium]|nr:alpha-mannosidase [Clostridia bacterium]